MVEREIEIEEIIADGKYTLRKYCNETTFEILRYGKPYDIRQLNNVSLAMLYEINHLRCRLENLRTFGKEK